MSYFWNFVSSAKLRPYIHACMNSAIRTNSCSRIHDDRAVVQNCKARTKHIDRYRESEFDRKLTKTMYCETPPKKIFLTVCEKFDLSKQALKLKNFVKHPSPTRIYSQSNSVCLKVPLVVCVRFDQAALPCPISLAIYFCTQMLPCTPPTERRRSCARWCCKKVRADRRRRERRADAAWLLGHSRKRKDFLVTTGSMQGQIDVRKTKKSPQR